MRAQGPRPRLLLRLHRCAAYHRAGVMFTRLSGGTKGPLLPKPRRRLSLDVRAPPGPPARAQTHTVTVAVRAARFRGRVSEGTFNPPANSFTSRDKKLKGARRLSSFTGASTNVLTFCRVFFSPSQE